MKDHTIKPFYHDIYNALEQLAGGNPLLLSMLILAYVALFIYTLYAAIKRDSYTPVLLFAIISFVLAFHGCVS